MITVQSLYRYPVKGLSAESLPRTSLVPGKVISGDRRFALRHAHSAFDVSAPMWHRKREFVVLAHTPEIAALQTSLNADTGLFRLVMNGQCLFEGNILTAAGRQGADDVLNSVLKDARGRIQLIDAGDIALTDVEPPYLSIINLASVRHLAEKVGSVVDVSRFRGNILIDGLSPWAELDWVGVTLSLGHAKLKVTKRIQRCVAISVNPLTAVRDVDVPAMLRQYYNHMDFGIYAEVVEAGIIQVCDTVGAL